MASDVPAPEVDSRVSVEPAAVPPMWSGDVSEVVTVTVPVKLAALVMVWPLMRPVARDVEKRLVEEAVVAKKLVEVAFVVVAWSPVKF